MRKRKKVFVIIVLTTTVLAIVGLFLIIKNHSNSNYYGTEWNVVESLIDSGKLSNSKYLIKEIDFPGPLKPDKLYYIANKNVERLLGPDHRVILYDVLKKKIRYEKSQIEKHIESGWYQCDSPEDLLKLTAKAAPLIYGCYESEHEILSGETRDYKSRYEHKILMKNNSSPSDTFPIITGVIESYGGKVPVYFVDYYAQLGPWNDIVKVHASFKDRHINVTLQPIFLNIRVYQ